MSPACLEKITVPAPAREPQRRNNNPRPSGLPVPDRHLGPRLPEIKLQQLAAAIDRALKCPRRRREQRPQLGDVVIDQRLAAIESDLDDQLEDPDAGQPRILAQQTLDLRLERIQP
jgi:hypothetical protein